jgi:hypothetical protein
LQADVFNIIIDGGKLFKISSVKRLNTYKMKIKGKEYSVSTYSGGSACVGVAIDADRISVVNTKEKTTIVEFTKAEWIAFIQGVKNGEFEPI